MAIPKLALIPSTVGGSVYSVLPSNGNGDFDFTRASAATRINAQGLIETVAVGDNRLNYPLIDGVVQGCPSLLLEPQRINLVQYSEDFSNAYWTKAGSSVVGGFTSPEGLGNAYKLVEDTSTGIHRVKADGISVSANRYNVSVFVKPNGRNEIRVSLANYFSSGTDAYFNLDTKVITYGTRAENGLIETFANGWFRCSFSSTSGELAGPNAFVYIDTALSNSNSYQGDGTSGVYIYGAQLEQGSYPTSYIPNSGTALGVTRSAETCNNAGDASTFNDSEGVLFAEVSAFNDSSIWRGISISDGTLSNKVSYFATGRGNANEARFDIIAAGSFQVLNYVVLNDITNSNKVAIKYKANDVGMWVNGFRLALDTNATMPSGLSKIQFANGNTSSPAENYYGNTKQIQYFDTALNDSDLETLTSWVSFSDMAIGQLYTIE